MNRTKILALGDSLVYPTGVGIQSNYIMTGLANTGRYEILQLAGAKHHPSYEPFKIHDYIAVHPVNEYGDKMTLRKALDEWKPDALWFITDPRFYMWMFEMADEVLARCPIFYWHVWDEGPTPKFNKPLYDSCSFIGSISRLTQSFLDELGYQNSEYIPHATSREIFYPQKERKNELRTKYFRDIKNINDQFVILWIGVNANRKRIGDMVLAFDQLLSIHPECTLIMKTRIESDEGINPAMFVEDLCSHVKLNKNLFLIENVSENGKIRDLQESEIAELYNLSDLLVNNSSHEGFGLSVLQALYTGTPVLVNRTGGMVGQLTNDQGEQQCGFFMDSFVRTLMGNVITPYIFEASIDYQVIFSALQDILNAHKSDKTFMKIAGEKCYEQSKNFSIEKMIDQWDRNIQKYIDLHKNTHRLYSIRSI